MPRGRKVWTADEDRELVRLRDNGLSVVRIAVRLNRTRRAIQVRLMKVRAEIRGQTSGVLTTLHT
jgi:hypothetical protein